MFLPPLFRRLFAVVWGFALFAYSLLQRITPGGGFGGNMAVGDYGDRSLARFMQDWELDGFDGAGMGLRRPQPARLPFSKSLPTFPVKSGTAASWRDKRVAVLETGEAHDEVMGALVYSLFDSDLEPRFFRRHGFRFNFLEAIAGFWPTPAWESSDDGSLEAAIMANEIDLLVFATCSETLPGLLPTLLAQPSQKLHTVCLQHWSNDVKDSPADYLPLARQGRLSLFTLADHVTQALQATLDDFALADREPGWESVSIDTFISTFPVDAARAVHARKQKTAAFPAKVGIQGNIENGRHDFSAVFGELDRQIRTDPWAWGYEMLVQPDGGEALYPLQAPDAPTPFELHLLGKIEHMPELPALLRSIVFFHQNLAYADFYALLASMDVLLPAFGHKGYVEVMASSSVPAALISRIPILATNQVTSSYSYVSGPALVPHPNSMDPVEAIRRLRLGQDPMAAAKRSTVRASQTWEAYERELDRHNGGVWERLLSRA